MHTAKGRIIETNNYLWLIIPDECTVDTAYYYDTTTGVVIKKDAQKMIPPDGALPLCAHCPKRNYPIFYDIPMFEGPNGLSDVLYYKVSVIDQWDPKVVAFAAAECNIDLSIHSYSPTVRYTIDEYNHRVVVGEYVYRKPRRKKSLSANT